MTGIPIVNVNNNCSTGSTALWLGHQAVKSGQSQCVMALGFEKMQAGALKFDGSGNTPALGKFMQADEEINGKSEAPSAPKFFGNAGLEHMKKYGTTKEQFAKIAWKNHKHSVNNPYA